MLQTLTAQHPLSSTVITMFARSIPVIQWNFMWMACWILLKHFQEAILPSTKPLTIGRMDNVETQYALRGSVDEVKLWDKEIPVAQVEQLKNQWATPAGMIDNELIARIYPNPAEEVIYIEFTDTIRAEHISLFASDGREESDLSGQCAKFRDHD